MTIRLTCNWAANETIFRRYQRYLPSTCEIELINEGDPDLWVVLNYPHNGFIPPPEHTLLYQYEPSWSRAHWPSPWSQPTEKQAKGCYTIPHYRMPFVWSFENTWSELASESPEKSRQISAVISSLRHSRMGVWRTDFIKSHAKQIKGLDVYGRGWQECPCNSFYGSIADKSLGLSPYKYTIAAENSRERNYLTEKLIDAIMCESLCFYDGCPNAEDFINASSFIRIDISNPLEAVEIINHAMENNEFEKRQAVIQKEKRRILMETGFFPQLKKQILSLV